MSSPTTKTFQYVLIPADSSRPVEARVGDTSGGLTDDELVKNAKAYFYEQSGGARKAAVLKGASPEQRQKLVQKFREEAAQANNHAVKELTEDQILSFVEAQHASPQTCEIMALTVPTKGNNYQAVSMYLAEQQGENVKKNERACHLLQACGHRLPETAGQKAPGVYGDMFVGRCYDNEGEGDEWLRVDFTEQDLEDWSDWMAVAKQGGGGGGSGASTVSSLSGTMGKFQEQQTIQQQQADLGYTWDQTEDEVEIRIVVDAIVKAKDVSIKFARSSLTVKIAGDVVVEGVTGGPVTVDESTYTLQDAGTGRELCIVLGKQEDGRTWAHAVKKS
jgi:hypothetical protein